jgi:hypothetical protein
VHAFLRARSVKFGALQSIAKALIETGKKFSQRMSLPDNKLRVSACMCWFELLKALSHLFKVTRPTFIDFGGGIGRLINVSEVAPAILTFVAGFYYMKG